MTKKHSSTCAASDSPPRNTTSGQSQFASTSTPAAAATIHWLSAMDPWAGWRRLAAIKVPRPPAIEAATIAQTGRGSFMAWLRGDDR